jgi:anti-anti-sigma factor
LGDVFEHGGE